MFRKVFVLGRSSIFAILGYALLAVLPLGLFGAPVAGQGLAVRVAPEFSSIGFDPSVGLDDAGFFGAAGALGFGRFVVLRASYKAASTQTALVGSGYGTAAEENSLDASLLSTSVQLRLGSGRFAPVLLGGGGIMTFSPVGRSDVKQIAATYGGGVDARLLPWLDGQLLVHPVRFRFDRASVADDSGGPPPVDPSAGDLRNSLALSASLGARLGGARSSSSADALDSDVSRALQGGDGLMIPVAVTAGILRFSEGLGIDDQSTAGIRAGLDFGPYFGIRGAYARGFSSTSFVGMSSWSGEAQFNVGKVTGFSPHVLLGYGGLSFWGDYVGQNGFLPDDQNALIIGGGFGVPVSERARLIVQLRDHLTTAGAISGVSTTADVRHNFGLSAGLSFNLRGGPQTLRQPAVGRPGVDPAVTPSVGAPDAVAAGVGEPSSAIVGDSTASAVANPAGMTAAGVPMAAVTDTARVVAPSTFQSDRVVSIPIPTQGELYIRYGPPAQRDAVVAAPQPSPSLPQIQTASTGGEAAGTSDAVTRSDLAALEITIGAMVRSEMARRDSISAERLTRQDLASIETRLGQQVAAALSERTDRPVAEPARSPELAALSAQVNELAALVRLRNEAQANPPMMVTMSPTGELVEVAGGSGAPFLRGADFLMGTSSVRNGNVGFGIRADVMVSEMLSGRLRPYVGAQLGQTGVDGTLGGTPYGGSVLSVGGGLGVATSLPTFRSIAPELSVGVVGVTGGVSGDSQPEADIMETIYGGFVMGPRVAVDAVWRGADRGPFAIAGGVARTWAGARGGWSIQMGVRWQRPFTRRQQLFVPTSGVPTSAAQPAASTNPPPAQRDTSQAVTPTEPVAPAVDSLTMARIAGLERALEEERTARQAMLAATDSAALAARALRVRADSLSRATAIANNERAVTESAAARRAAIRTELESLLGVVEDVQAVRETSRGLEVTIGGGVFPTSSVSLEGSARARVMRVASIMARTEGYAFLVDGHTDSTGSDETNRTVSEARAEAVRAVLIGAGIRPQQISVLASGEDRPIAGNDTRDGRAQNRRVEIVILDY